MAERTPWAAWLRRAALLGLAPSAFWRLSMREWRAIASENGAPAMDKAALHALAARFPDTRS